MGEKIIQAALPQLDGGVAVSSLSHVRLFVTSWTVALQGPLLCGSAESNNNPTSTDLLTLYQSARVVGQCPWVGDFFKSIACVYQNLK